MDLIELGRIFGSYINILICLFCRFGFGWYIMVKEGLIRFEVIDFFVRYFLFYSKLVMVVFILDINSMYVKRYRILICLLMFWVF